MEMELCFPHVLSMYVFYGCCMHNSHLLLHIMFVKSITINNED